MGLSRPRLDNGNAVGTEASAEQVDNQSRLKEWTESAQSEWMVWISMRSWLDQWATEIGDLDAPTT